MDPRTLLHRAFPVILPLLLILLLAAPAAPVEAPPGIDGAWSGTMSGKTTPLDTGVASTKVRVPVSLVASQAGADATLTLTVHWVDGDEVFDMAGKSGNRGFWAYNGDPSAPFMIVGTIGGKAPRLKLKARGILATGIDVSEVTLSLKKSQVTLQGTAAAGSPAAGATVTLKDRNGTSAVAVAGDDGSFLLDAAGLTPPFLIRVDIPLGGTLYGVASETGVANVHPLTDLILRNWYEVDGSDLVVAFDTLGPTTPVPSAVEVALLEGLVRRAIRKWLLDGGLDPDSFDLIRSQFTADGSGFDGVLDETTVAPDGTSLSVTDGTTTQDSGFNADSVTGTVTVSTTTTAPSGSSASQDSTVLPQSDALQEAVAGALATMESFRAKVNARGAALTASDLTGFLTADFLDEGSNRTWWTAENASDIRGGAVGSVDLRSVRSFDGGAGLLTLDLVLSVSGGGESQKENLRMTFKKSGSSWLMYGNRELARINVKVEYRTDYYPGSVDGPRKHVNVDVRAPVGTVQSVSISGGGIFSATDAPKDSHTDLRTVNPTPTTQLDLERDPFFTGADPADFPAPGTEFTVTVTPVSGPAQFYTVVAGGNTTETVSILQPTGNSLATDAHPGTPFTGQWSLPTTFALERIRFSGNSFTTSFACSVDPASPTTTTDTLGSLTIPATCGGETTSSANFNLSFDGPNGERIEIIYTFE